MSHGTNILFNISLFKLSELSPSWVFNVTEILESLLTSLSYRKLWTVLLGCQNQGKHGWNGTPVTLNLMDS